jgi:predicted phage terminase large subunit-like protein
VWVIDVVATQDTPLGVERLIRQTAELDGRNVPIYIEQEPGSSGKNLISHYTRNVLRGFIVRGIPSSGSKPVRAEPVSAAAESGNVMVVAGPWMEKRCRGLNWLEELEGFPFGEQDDRADSLAGVYEQLTHGYLHPTVGVAGAGGTAGLPDKVAEDTPDEDDDDYHQRIMETAGAWGG